MKKLNPLQKKKKESSPKVPNQQDGNSNMSQLYQLVDVSSLFFRLRQAVNKKRNYCSTNKFNNNLEINSVPNPEASLRVTVKLLTPMQNKKSCP